MVIFISLLSCDNNIPSDEPIFDKNKAITEIKTAYSQWSIASENKDISTMYRLSYPGGNFEGMTNVCIDDWNSGGILYYKFSSVSVRYVDENEATIEGIADMIQGPNGHNINFKSNFVSGAVFYDGKWLLDGFNGFQDWQLIETY